MQPTGNTLTWGAKAYAAFSGGAPEVYACPLCGLVFPLAEAKKLMSKEHAPPGKLAGTSITWTCAKTCNNQWGNLYESKLVEYDRALDFHLGMMRSDERIAVTMEVAGHSVIVDVVRVGSDFAFFPDVERNPPSVLNAVDAAIAQYTGGEDWQSLHVRFLTPNVNKPWETRIAALRTAYLVAHATLGYTYSFSDGLACVRDQLRKPQDELAPSIIAHAVATSASSPRDRRAIFQPTYHDHLQCLAVQFGRYTVILPLADSPYDFYETFDFADLLRHSESGPIECIRYEWPSPPQYLLDLNPVDAAVEATFQQWQIDSKATQIQEHLHG